MYYLGVFLSAVFSATVDSVAIACRTSLDLSVMSYVKIIDHHNVDMIQHV